MKGSLIIVGCFVLGVMGGQLGCHAPQQANFYALVALMIVVGIGIGGDWQVWTRLKNLPYQVWLLPLFTIVGTLAGCLLVSVLIPQRSWSDCLAVGSGLGYYSLSSIFITQYCGAELGTVALVANLMREIFTLLAAPLLVRYWGKFAPIASGGVTSMDTTLPIITHVSGESFAIIALYHGCVLEISVPLLVSLFCQFS